MKLQPKVINADGGTAHYAVVYQGQIYEVDPGQDKIKINGVNFQIDTGCYKAEEPATEEIPESESEEAPKPKKSRKSKK